MNKSALQEQFSKGQIPKALTGFYYGILELLLPATPLEQLGEIVSRFWLPWYGKTFDPKDHSGSNLVPSYFRPFLQFRYGKKIFAGSDEKGLHVFPFKTRVARGLNDDKNVLQLDYSLPENPARVRTVIDELVEAGENNYLGKAYLKEGKHVRLVAFFRLRK